MRRGRRPCPVQNCDGKCFDAKPKRRKTYDTGFRDGVLFAVVIQVVVFAAVGAGAAVIALLPA